MGGLFKGVNIGANVLKFAVAIVGATLAVMVAVNWNEKTENRVDIIGDLDWCLYIVYAAMAICFAVAILFGIYKFITNISGNKGGLIGLIVFAGIILFGWFGISRTKVMDYVNGRGEFFVDDYAEGKVAKITDSSLGLSESGLTIVYILMGLVLASILVGEVITLIKRR